MTDGKSFLRRCANSSSTSGRVVTTKRMDVPYSPMWTLNASIKRCRRSGSRISSSPSTRISHSASGVGEPVNISGSTGRSRWLATSRLTALASDGNQGASRSRSIAAARNATQAPNGGAGASESGPPSHHRAVSATICCTSVDFPDPGPPTINACRCVLSSSGTDLTGSSGGPGGPVTLRRDRASARCCTYTADSGGAGPSTSRYGSRSEACNCAASRRPSGDVWLGRIRGVRSRGARTSWS